MQVNLLSIYLFLATSSWMLMSTVSFFVKHKPSFLSTATKHRMAVKHYWGAEQEVHGYLDSNVGIKGTSPHEQCRGVYGTLIKQKCVHCGAVREKEKDPFHRDWSSLWELDFTDLLACPLQSSDVTYIETYGWEIKFHRIDADTGRRIRFSIDDT